MTKVKKGKRSASAGRFSLVHVRVRTAARLPPLALTERGSRVQQQEEIKANFEGHLPKRSYRPDLIVCDQVVIEIKCVTQLTRDDDQQLLTYMRHSRIERGLLLNFHAGTMVAGIRRLILTPNDP